MCYEYHSTFAHTHKKAEAEGERVDFVEQQCYSEMRSRRNSNKNIYTVRSKWLRNVYIFTFCVNEWMCVCVRVCVASERGLKNCQFQWNIFIETSNGFLSRSSKFLLSFSTLSLSLPFCIGIVFSPFFAPFNHSFILLCHTMIKPSNLACTFCCQRMKILIEKHIIK